MPVFCDFVLGLPDPIDAIYSSITSKICAETGISPLGDTLLDSLKFEANANKHKYRWKSTMRIAKLLENFAKLMAEADIDVHPESILSLSDMAKEMTALAKAVSEEGGNPEYIPSGKGKRQTAFQRL